MIEQTNRQKPFVGQKVIANGYPGTITKLCEWTNSMVEVRLGSGTVCVDYLTTIDNPSQGSIYRGFAVED